MVGIILVSHGELASGLASSVSMICGPQEMLKTISLQVGDDVDDLKEKIKDAIVEMNTQSEGDGVLILADVLGGSPSNAIARSLYELGDKVKAECLTGANLSMLLEVVSSRGRLNLKELLAAGMQAGSSGIINLKERINY